jgi:hypothetical protein
MDDSRDALEQPFVWTVSQIEDIATVVRGSVPAKLAPAPGDDGSDAGGLDSIQQHFGECLGVIDDDATEPNVDWWRAGLEEIGQLWVRSVGRWVSEEEAADIYSFRQSALGVKRGR